MGNAKRVIELLGSVFGDGDAQVDEAAIDRFAAAVGELAEDDFVTEMISVGGVARSFEGADGMREGLGDWLESFASLRFEPEDIRELGENVVTVAKQIAVTRHEGIELEQPSATVWRFRNGCIYRVEWHLDRTAAERSAARGVDEGGGQ